MKRLISAIVALFLILFGTVGCNEEMQVPEEPTAMVSPAELLKELRRDFRKENDALAFHLRLHNGNFNSQDLIRSYLSEHFGYGSSALNAYEKALIRVPNVTFRSDSEQQFFTNAALTKIDFYVNSAENFDHPQDYISFLDQEFASYLSADLSDETNLGLALWLALHVESIDFIVANLDLLGNNKVSSSARVYHHYLDGVKKWWGENKKCLGALVGYGIGGALAGCATGIMAVKETATLAGATGVGLPVAGKIVAAGCLGMGAVGAVGGILVGLDQSKSC